jgi:hypothetical protein
MYAFANPIICNNVLLKTARVWVVAPAMMRDTGTQVPRVNGTQVPLVSA